MYKKVRKYIWANVISDYKVFWGKWEFIWKGLISKDKCSGYINQGKSVVSED